MLRRVKRSSFPCRGHRKYTTQKLRPSVGAIIFNRERKILCGKRMDIGYWQFPQGGVDKGEDHIAAAFREVAEELGLTAANLKPTEDQFRGTFTYHRKIVKDGKQYDGQEQRYILFRWDGDAHSCNLHVNGQPEFSKVAWLTWDELLSQSVPSRTEIYMKLRTWAEEVIEKYNILDDLVAIQVNSDGKTHRISRFTKDDYSASWLLHQLPSPDTIFPHYVSSDSLSTTRSTTLAKDNNYLISVPPPQNTLPTTPSASMLDMGVTNWNYLMDNCKY